MPPLSEDGKSSCAPRRSSADERRARATWPHQRSRRRSTCQTCGVAHCVSTGSQRAVSGQLRAAMGMKVMLDMRGCTREEHVRRGFERQSRTSRAAERRWKVAVVAEESRRADLRTCGASGGTQRRDPGLPRGGSDRDHASHRAPARASVRARRRPDAGARARISSRMVLGTLAPRAADQHPTTARADRRRAQRE